MQAIELLYEKQKRLSFCHRFHAHQQTLRSHSSVSTAHLGGLHEHPLKSRFPRPLMLAALQSGLVASTTVTKCRAG